MKKYEIYVSEEWDEYDLLNAQINKACLSFGIAIKILDRFYEVSFFTKDSLKRLVNDNFSIEVNIIFVEKITVSKMNKAINLLIDEGYFNQLKSYDSFEHIRFFSNGKHLKGKLLSDIITEFHIK